MPTKKVWNSPLAFYLWDCASKKLQHINLSIHSLFVEFAKSNKEASQKFKKIGLKHPNKNMPWEWKTWASVHYPTWVTKKITANARHSLDQQTSWREDKLSVYRLYHMLIGRILEVFNAILSTLLLSDVTKIFLFRSRLRFCTLPSLSLST